MRIARRPAARIDVVEIAVYLGTEADQAIADHFLEAVERAYAQLAKMPRMGSSPDFTAHPVRAKP